MRKLISGRAVGASAASLLALVAVALGSPQRIADREGPGIHNLVEWTPGILSGAAPEGEAAFEHLRSLGVKTVISVDGGRPEIEFAEKNGIRYVHIPIRYNGIDPEDREALAAAFRDLPRPIYLHCHHGKHRGPAATALALTLLGELTSEEAVEGMKTAGTAPSYKGLYRCVSESDALPEGAIAPRGEDVPSVAEVESYVEAMVTMEIVLDHLREIQKAGWKPPAEHPDLVPVSEAGLLHDAVRAAHADPISAKQPEDFRQWMAESLADTLALETILAAPTVDAPEADRLIKAIDANCKACHVIYRNE